MTEIVEMGKRIELFRNSVEIDKAKLEGYWKEWDELQGEYVELGREVFGTDLFVCDKSGEGERKGGHKVEVEDLYREFENTVVALREEVEEIAAEFLEIMEDSEKVSSCATVVRIGGADLCCRSWRPLPGNNSRNFFKQSFREIK